MNSRRGVLVLAHGSRRAEADDLVIGFADRLRADLNTDLLEPAFVQLAQPDIPTGVDRLVKKGCRELVVLCLFLVNGNHLTKDVPALLEEALAPYAGVSYTLTPPLLQAPEMYGHVIERLQADLGPDGRSLPTSPAGIEAMSFDLIAARLNGQHLSDGERAVVQRVIHATADFGYAVALRFQGDPVGAAIRALQKGCPVIVDSNMVRAGISGNRAGEVLCRIQDVKSLSAETGKTRASLAMEHLADRMDGAVVAIGNAPTALVKVIELVESGRAKPAVVVGVPVGLVGALEAKRRLSGLEGQPHITNLAQKGGSAVAAAVVNALIKLAEGERIASLRSQ